MKTPFYQPFFKCCLLLLFACFSFFQNGNAATEIRTIPTHFESKKLSKKMTKWNNKVKKKAEKQKRKRRKNKSGYDDFDYNILLVISLGFLGLSILSMFFSPVLALVFVLTSGLMSMICISNNAHFVAWIALGAAVLIFLPIGFAVILSGQSEE